MNNDILTIEELLKDFSYRDLVIESLLKNQVQLTRLERESITYGSGSQEIQSILTKINKIDCLLDAIELYSSTKVMD